MNQQSQDAKREQAFRYRVAQAKRRLEELLRFGGWSRTEAEREVAREASRLEREVREG